MESEFSSADELNLKAGGREEEMKGKEAGQNEDAGKGSANGSVEGLDLSGNKLFQTDANSSRSAVPTCTENATSHASAQLTIFYGGRVNVFNGIPPEKVHEIVLMASAAATAANFMKSIATTTTSPVLTRSPSLQSSSTALASPQAQQYPVQGSPLRKSQVELPMARKQSLQRFFEKRRDRLMSKNPYPAKSGGNMSDDVKPNISGEISSDTGHCGKPAMPQEELRPKAAANFACVNY